jgi:acyl-CoA thioester hydrolase
MPLTLVRTFRVRHYECDAYGHVNNVNYLRYMQEAAFDASAAAGYDLARYSEMDRHWLIRETEIEYLRPLRYGDSVQVKTWVADFRRVRSRRAYELRHSGSGDLVARASTDWVFLDISTGRPTKIPVEMKAAFFPEGPPPPGAAPARFPAAPPPPPGVFRMVRRVEWRDLDQVHHVNNAVYLAYIEDCGLQVSAAHGWPLQRIQREGFAIVARRHQIEYRQPAVYGDELELATWVSDLKRSTVLRHMTLSRVVDGATVARARTLWVWVDLETGRPIRIPRQFLDDFSPNIVGTVEPEENAQNRSPF